VILGGSDFKITAITQEMYRNFHHYFVDITDRDPEQLHAVLEEPVEVDRRPKVEPDIAVPDIRPAGARSVWDGCIQELAHTLSGPLPKELTVAELRQILDNIPARGYSVDTPSFEYLSHAMLSGQMYFAAFRNCVAAERASAKVKDATVKKMDELMDTMADWQGDTDAMDLIRNIGETLNHIRNTASAAAEMDRVFYEEVVRAMEGIPGAGIILRPLPVTVVPAVHRNLVEFARKAIRQLDYDTFAHPLSFVKLEDWMTPVALDDGSYTLVQPPFTLRGAPLKNEKPTDGNIWDLLAVPKKIQSTSEPNTNQDPSPSTMRRKGKSELSNSPADGLNHRSTRSGGGGHIVWKFTNPGSNFRVACARECCILLGIPRSNSWKEMAERCEKEINTNRRFYEQAATRYGKILPGP
jgi:hypothetical protein